MARIATRASQAICRKVLTRVSPSKVGCAGRVSFTRREGARGRRSAATDAAMARIAALPARFVTGPAASNTRPPAVAPSVMASWITATIRPPPASASSGSVRASQVPQATGPPVAVQTPEREETGHGPGPGPEQGHREREAGHNQRDRHERDGQARADDPADQKRADEAPHAVDEKERRQGRDLDAGHLLEERTQVGEERELAHEEQQDRSHADRHAPVPEEPQDAAGPDPARSRAGAAGPRPAKPPQPGRGARPRRRSSATPTSSPM